MVNIIGYYSRCEAYINKKHARCPLYIPLLYVGQRSGSLIEGKKIRKTTSYIDVRKTNINHGKNKTCDFYFYHNVMGVSFTMIIGRYHSHNDWNILWTCFYHEYCY